MINLTSEQLTELNFIENKQTGYDKTWHRDLENSDAYFLYNVTREELSLYSSDGGDISVVVNNIKSIEHYYLLLHAINIANH